MSTSQKDDDGQEYSVSRELSLSQLNEDYCWHVYKPGESYKDSEPIAQCFVEEDAQRIAAALADHRDTQQLREFMEWLTDQQVVHWTLTEETANDPRKAVEALLQTYLNEINAFYPAVSEIAAKAAESDVLRERVRVLEEALREMLDHLHNPFPDGTPRDGYTMKGHGIAYAAAVRHARTLLLSPAAATEGGEGA